MWASFYLPNMRPGCYMADSLTTGTEDTDELQEKRWASVPSAANGGFVAYSEEWSITDHP